MNIVLTHNASYRAEGATVVTSLDQAMALAAKDAAAENTGEIAVIGGSVGVRGNAAQCPRGWKSPKCMATPKAIRFPAIR